MWTESIIVAIPEQGKDLSQAQNYRPISLTCCICKLLEKIINIRLCWYLERHDIINQHQSGFRHNRSTTDNLVQIETEIQQSLVRKQHFVAVFFDQQKAYDTSWRYGIIERLHNIGMRGNLPIFLKNFLNNRKIRVRVGNILSEEKDVTEGIPQGSVLSCTLFMIAIDGICNVIPQNIGKTLYVDDFTIYTSGANSNMLERRLQTAITNLENWCNRTGFTFSASKTVSLHICHKKNCPKFSLNLTLYNTPIQSVDSFRYLGVIFDKSLTWRPHLIELKKKL